MTPHLYFELTHRNIKNTMKYENNGQEKKKCTWDAHRADIKAYQGQEFWIECQNEKSLHIKFIQKFT